MCVNASRTDEGHEPDVQYRTLIGLLRERVALYGDKQCYVWAAGGERQDNAITYRQLERRARSLAAWLQASDATDKRVLLLMPEGLDYIVAFFACIFARSVAVPGFPPHRNRQLVRIRAIAEDSCPSLILTTRDFMPQVKLLCSHDRGEDSVRVCAIEDVDDQLAPHWQEPAVGEDTLAFLQYTSGSTTTPKGVMITHKNLLHNERIINRAFRQSDDSVIVGWLPLFHDMGLIGNVIQTVYAGARCVLLSPSSFLQNPASWLQTISRYHATTSGGPNFAYELCARKIDSKQCESIDLSSWKTAFCGAETVRKETLDRFATLFSSCGFRSEAFCPCYGLAEATLFVSGGLPKRRPKSISIRPTALKENRWEPLLHGDTGGRAVVSCGVVGAGTAIKIVDCSTMNECPPGQIGEIWVSGASVADGYWQRPDESRRTFRARLATGKGTFLRTGDLGIVDDGELYVTGRAKDVVIIRGLNHYPEDIEFTMGDCHPRLRPGCGAAFSVEIEGEEQLVLVQEVDKTYQPSELMEIIASIRESVTRDHELHVYGVVLIRSATLPKTSSGKVQRSACRSAFLEKSLSIIESNFASAAEMASACRLPIISRAQVLGAVSSQQRAQMLQNYLRLQLAAVLGLNLSEIAVHHSLTALGLDSLQAMELQSRLERDMQVSLPMTDFLRLSTISELALLTERELSKPIAEFPQNRSLAPAKEDESLLSSGQQRLWFLDRLAPGNPAYNIPLAVRVIGAISVIALEQAITEIVARHEVLRVIFTDSNGQPHQLPQETTPIRLRLIDATGNLARDSANWMMSLASEEAKKPFDLSTGPLLRTQLLNRSGHESMLLATMHHIVSDAWSAGIFFDELTHLYEAYLQGEPSPLPKLSCKYSDFVFCERQQLQGDILQSRLAYWRQVFRKRVSSLELPVDHVGTSNPMPAAGTHTSLISTDLREAITRTAKDERSTLFMTLLSAFYVVLYHYTGQTDICIGFPTAGRNRADFRRLIGFFVNTLVLRIDLSGNPTFRELLHRVRDRILEGLARQDLPFGQLVAAVAPERTLDQSPLYRVWFGLRAITPRAISLPGAKLIHIDLDSQNAKVDLAAHIIVEPEATTCKFEYNRDLFEPGTIDALARDFHAVLGKAVCSPDTTLQGFEIVLEGYRRHQQLQQMKYEGALRDKFKHVQRGGFDKIAAS